MSYNGIGLSTARGSGTNGYVQKNLSSLGGRRRFETGRFAGRKRYEEDVEISGKKFEKSNLTDRKIDHSILDHERKRNIEAKCYELQDQLEEEGLSEDEINKRVDALRRKLSRPEEERRTSHKSSSTKWNRSDSPQDRPRERQQFQAHQVHDIAAAKAVENDRLKRALRIKDKEGGGRRPSNFERRISPSRSVSPRRSRRESGRRDDSSDDSDRSRSPPDYRRRRRHGLDTKERRHASSDSDRSPSPGNRLRRRYSHDSVSERSHSRDSVPDARGHRQRHRQPNSSHNRSQNFDTKRGQRTDRYKSSDSEHSESQRRTNSKSDRRSSSRDRISAQDQIPIPRQTSNDADKFLDGLQRDHGLVLDYDDRA